jgi:DNA polymerase-3 subunit delta'
VSHPRDTFELQGVEAQDAAFLDALARGRLHHAWLLTGPEGVGKASFAYRAARRLLGAAPDAAYGALGAAPEDTVSRLVASRSHPDLMVLERETVDGKTKKSIAVDAARELPEFFAKAPGLAPYRVAIVDSADDLNDNSANALLKTLEEPPPRGVLFLVSHAPGALLPTIRSRCRRLAFPPWPEEAVSRFVHARTGVAQEMAHRAARVSGGAPGRALASLGDGGLDLDAAAEDIVNALPAVDAAALSTLADRFRGSEGLARFLIFFEHLGAHLALRAEGLAEAPGQAALWADAWSQAGRTAAAAEALNLDRTDVLWTTVAGLKRVAGGRPC